MLVSFLIKEGCYREAAKVVSGFADLFTSYPAIVGKFAATEDGDSLELAVNEAKAEFAYQQQWASEVLPVLSTEVGAYPLEEAFALVDAAGTAMLEAILTHRIVRREPTDPFTQKGK
jgi:hypothetical protein